MKRIGATMALAVGAVAGGFVVPAMASASQCPVMAVCMWKDSNYGGTFSWRQPGFPLWNISNANNDTVTAWRNRSDTRAAAYEHANGRGACLNMTPMTQVYNVGSWWNDRISSWKTNGGCSD